MNNGLRGRYEPGLRQWNNARSIAAELVRSFYGGERALSDVLDEHELAFPSIGEITVKLMSVSTSDGRSTIDSLARWIMGWNQ